MKKLLLSAFVAFAMLASTKTLAQQGFGTNTPDKSAAVDIVSSKRGLLIPRLALTETTNQAPIPLSIAPATSLFVYNTATVNDVIPGFYYWDGAKWVRFVSSSTEKNVVVTAGKNVEVNSAVSTDGLTTTYTVAIAEGTANGQVLVTKETSPGVFTSEWVNPDDFISGVNGITITPNPTTGVNEIGIGGSLTDTTGTEIATDPITGKTLAITGLEILDATAFNPATQNIMVMGADGILKQVAPKTLIEDAIAADNLTAKALSSAGGIITVNGSASVTNSVLKDVELGIANKSIGAEKLNPGTATAGQIATVVESTPGNKEIQYVDPSTAIGKALTTDNIIGVGADATAASATTANLLNGAVLTPTYLKIKDDAITATQIAENAVGASELADNSVASANIIDGSIANADLGEKSVSANKLTSTVTNAAGVVTSIAPANTVPTADGSGGVTYQTIAAAAGEDLTTDGKIVIGSTNATILEDAVLVPTNLKIAANSITSTDIKDGTIQASDLKAPGTTTDSNTGGTANQMLVTDNSGNVSWQPQSGVAMAGDVTGTTGANEISKLQGVNVAAKDANAPANGEVLTYDDSTKAWTPKTVAEAAGKELSTDGVIVIGANASATETSAPSSILADVKLNIGTDKITATHIAENAVTASELADNSVASANIIDGSVQAADIQAPNSLTNTGGTANQVMVTNSSGDVAWVNQSDLANKDNYTFATPLAKSAGTANATGGLDYNVTIATASATTLGVVKQSATTGEEITIATDGSLSINEANVTVGTVAGSDVTGKLNDLTVTGIQGTAVSETAPTAANNMLVYNSTTNQWEPSTVAAAAGKTLTGAGITVTPGANATPGTATSLASTVLADVTLGIANDAITNDKLADDAVKTENIENGAVTNEDLALKAVTADKMESKNIATGTNVAAGMVPTADGSGGVEYKTINNTVAVINGLRKDATAADVIKLGGDLIEATAINTSVGSTGNTLAITGLANVAPATATKNKVIVAETTGGVLRTVDKIVTGTNVEVAANANYSFHTPEVVINVTLGNTDQTITFPSAASAEGQVINIKIANTTEAHTGYLNVLDTYGAMPYQAWIVKSNGTTWEIVGRN